MNYLVIGGAEYIESHLVRMLQKNNHDVSQYCPQRRKNSIQKELI